MVIEVFLDRDARLYLCKKEPIAVRIDCGHTAVTTELAWFGVRLYILHFVQLYDSEENTRFRTWEKRDGVRPAKVQKYMPVPIP